MDIGIEQKDKKTEILENKLGIAGCKVTEEMNETGVKKVSFDRKSDRIMNRINSSLNNHKYNKNLNFHSDKKLFIETTC